MRSTLRCFARGEVVSIAGEFMLSRLFSFVFWPQKPQGEAQAQRKLNEAARGKCSK
ncbi:hypothetical protein M23134_05854 [Microscilla marina ATCC 23134]|uniref:Uncharacterized protein n=1 Tax=Microscilla marina ATCC 23134 TaxID=313606 RepID=A1ZXK4_MICM2|nr:hypothetical protein M23134_05854 [Microscilla marina ATCC 23134]